MARKWLAKLEDLEARLQEDQIEHLGRPAENDGVTADYIRKNRAALLEGIQSAKKYFTDMSR